MGQHPQRLTADMVRILGGKHKDIGIYLEPIKGNYLRKNGAQSSARPGRSPRIRHSTHAKRDPVLRVPAQRANTSVYEALPSILRNKQRSTRTPDQHSATAGHFIDS